MGLDESWSVWSFIRHQGTEIADYSGIPAAMLCGGELIRCEPIRPSEIGSFSCDIPAVDGRAMCQKGEARESDVLYVYGVDTSEYEDGGDPVRNAVLERDLTRVEHHCSQRSPAEGRRPDAGDTALGGRR